MSRLRASLAFLLVLVAPHAAATAQAPDRIKVDGEVVALDTNPLGTYLEAHPKALPEPEVTSSGNWRGYIAEWAIEGNDLVLTRIEMTFAGKESSTYEQRNVMDTVFPGQDRVAATWYSGTLTIPRGKLTRYVHMGYGSTYERYTLVTIDHGQVKQRGDLTSEQFDAYRAAKFEAYKKSPEYAAKLKKVTHGKSSLPKDMAEGFLASFESERYLSMDLGVPFPTSPASP